VKEPTFAERQEFARYIDEINRLSGNRPAPAAFIDLPADDPSDHHLSVNSLEMESRHEIAASHRRRVSPIDGKVALCIHRIHHYNDAARKAGIDLRHNKNSARWEFTGLTGAPEQAYRYRPVLKSEIPVELRSKSHCGVEYACMMKRNEAQKFARQLTKNQKFHLFFR
jgi:hypothetical protein